MQRVYDHYATPRKLPRRITIDLDRGPLVRILAPDALELARLAPIAARIEWLLARMLAREAA